MSNHEKNMGMLLCTNKSPGKVRVHSGFQFHFRIGPNYEKESGSGIKKNERNNYPVRQNFRWG